MDRETIQDKCSVMEFDYYSERNGTVLGHVEMMRRLEDSETLFAKKRSFPYILLVPYKSKMLIIVKRLLGCYSWFFTFSTSALL